MFYGKEMLTPSPPHTRYTAGFNYLPNVTAQKSVDLENTACFPELQNNPRGNESEVQISLLCLAMYTATEYEREMMQSGI